MNRSALPLFFEYSLDLLLYSCQYLLLVPCQILFIKPYTPSRPLHNILILFIYL